MTRRVRAELSLSLSCDITAHDLTIVHFLVLAVGRGTDTNGDPNFRGSVISHSASNLQKSWEVISLTSPILTEGFGQGWKGENFPWENQTLEPKPFPLGTDLWYSLGCWHYKPLLGRRTHFQGF